MKIAHVVCVYPPYKGGIGNVARDFAELSAGSGNDVSVFYPRKRIISDFKSSSNIKIFPLRPWLKYGNGAFLPQLFFYLKNFDVVHLHYPFFGTAETVFLAKMWYRKRFKLYIHYHMDTNALGFVPRLLSVFSKMIMRPLFRQADLISCASLDYVSSGALKKIYAKYREKFFLLPFGVDTEKFFPLTKKTNSPEISLLFVGGLDRAHYFKGLEVLIEALTKIKNEKIKLNVVGEGELKDVFRNLAFEKGVGKRVTFCGGVNDDDLSSLYRKSDVFILPSINGHEAFGVVLLEAMASGVPVIASALPGVREVFKEGEQGLFAEPGNADDLSDKIKRLAADESLRKKMGDKGRSLAIREYSFEALKKRLEKMYENLPNQ